jgi:hypothetical protein
MQIVKTLLGTNTNPATDAETLRAKHGEAARRILTGQQELLVLSGQLELWKLERGGLLEDQDAGEDVTDALRRVDGRITRDERERDDLGPRLAARQQQAATLEAAVRSAEREEAPAQMRDLATLHGELRDQLRADASGLKSLADRIIASESAMQGIFHAHGLRAEGVLVIEGLATPLRDLANDTLARLEWQDAQAVRGAELEAEIARNRDAVDVANREAGYELYRSPAASYFASGWLDETTDQRTARVNG